MTDSGAMGSYVVFYLAGMYPLPGTRQFLLSTPYFPSISFYNPLFNSTTSIASNHFGGNNIYVQVRRIFVLACYLSELLRPKNVTVDGIPYKSSCYLEWDVFEAGSTVVLELSSDPEVGCGENGLPPSLSTGGYA